MTITFLGALTIALIVLKLLDIITWNWALVLLPAYGPVLLVAVAYAGLEAYSHFYRRKRRKTQKELKEKTKHGL